MFVVVDFRGLRATPSRTRYSSVDPDWTLIQPLVHRHSLYYFFGLSHFLRSILS